MMNNKIRTQKVFDRAQEIEQKLVDMGYEAKIDKEDMFDSMLKYGTCFCSIIRAKGIKVIVWAHAEKQNEVLTYDVSMEKCRYGNKFELSSRKIGQIVKTGKKTVYKNLYTERFEELSERGLRMLFNNMFPTF